MKLETIQRKSNTPKSPLLVTKTQPPPNGPLKAMPIVPTLNLAKAKSPLAPKKKAVNATKLDREIQQ